MPPFRNLVGMKFGRLYVIEREGTDYPVKFRCKCDCGNEKIILSASLIGGNTTSCGCFRKEQALKATKKHGMWRSRMYNCWLNMKQRCYYEKSKFYKDYGGRGITVCDEWKNSFEAFYEWSMENGYNDKLTIDRIDVNGNYEPSNCRWATRKEQQLNRRTNVLHTLNGVTMAESQWCEKLGGEETLIISRLKRGWTIEEALTIPASNKKRISTIRKESTKALVSAISCLPVEQCSQEIE